MMISFSTKVDLHIHTTCSDGELGVDEVLAEAKAKGLDFVGIVDHDTLAQFKLIEKSPLAAKMQREGTKLWVGTEFSARLGNIKMHLLGYNFDYRHPKISELMKRLEQCRADDLEYKLEHLRKKGVTFTAEQLAEFRRTKNVGKPHLARAMQKNGVAESVPVIIEKYFGDCNRVIRVEAAEVIKAVKAAGGLVVIAHPYQIEKENKISLEEARKVWEQLAHLGAQGMECFYSKYDLEKATALLSEAKRLNLVVTMGSDFHGEHVKPGLKIGEIIKQ